MCGIAGAFVLSGEFRVTEPYLAVMRDTMRLRGPDGCGTWVAPDGRVGLAHRRLSIIDLSSCADQPMQNEDGRLRVVFNGEIYNHADVRRELERRGGHRWRTDHSDTEVILHAWEEWGAAALDRFRGMFAFALWDARERELWLVRDRMGIKPLYYSLHHGRLTFASEIKALLADPDQPAAVNEEALFHYLSFIATPAPQTMFAGIRKLPNGCLLRVRAGAEPEVRRWYDVWDHVVPQRDLSDAELRERLLDELRTAVRLRKVSDVPVGVFLSGGVDSSTNVALFSEGSTGTVKTFSIGYDAEYDSYRNELHHAAAVARRFGTEHHERRLSVDDLLGFLPEMVRLQDEPIADPVCVPLYYLSQLAREQGVVVAQAGEGADELFFGYENWRTKWRLQRLAGAPVPRLAHRAALGALALAGRSRSKPYEALARAARGQPLFWGTTEAFTDVEKRALLSPRLRGEFRGLSSWEPIAPIWARFREKAWEPSWLHWMSYVDLSTRLPELLLMRLDKMTMGVSLEGRVPFLDHKFVELVLGVPEARKIPNGELKHLLKGSVRGVIPDEVIDRRKQGFGVPVTEWLLGRLGGEMRATLNRFCDRTDYLDRGAVAAMANGGQDGRLWFLLNLALWWEAYVG
jgi:asparagine synthase (glutamine-hydrolysing)